MLLWAAPDFLGLFCVALGFQFITISIIIVLVVIITIVPVVIIIIGGWSGLVLTTGLAYYLCYQKVHCSSLPKCNPRKRLCKPSVF